MLQFAFLHRLLFFIIALFCIFLFPGLSSGKAAVFLMLLFIAAFTGSFAIPTWLHFFAKTVDVRKRGRLLSLRMFSGSLLGILAGFLISKVLSSFAFPVNYGILFLTTFLLMLLSFLSLSRVHEENEVFEFKAEKHPVKAGWEMLQSDKNFRSYVITDMLGQWISTATAFFPVYAVSRFNAGAGAIGTFTSLLMIGMLVANPVLGYLADKKGHKINILIYHVFTALACLSAVFSTNLYIFGAVFLLSAVAQTVLGISRTGIALEMSHESKRRMYISVIGTFSSVFVISGLIHGVFIELAGYETVFIADAGIALIAAWMVHKKVVEPRGQPIHE
ncbi:MAG: MFS transporter [Ignavibacteriales bacterium]|nr:MFS transporter [Ignavibacteriales bacterium]